MAAIIIYQSQNQRFTELYLPNVIKQEENLPIAEIDQ